MHFSGVICPDFVHVNVVSTFWTKLVYASHGSTMSIRESVKFILTGLVTTREQGLCLEVSRLLPPREHGLCLDMNRACTYT